MTHADAFPFRLPQIPGTIWRSGRWRARFNMPEPLLHDTGIFVVAQVQTFENRVGRALCPRQLWRQLRSWFR